MTTASGGEPKAFNSVRLFLFKVFKASWAAINAGSALAKSSAQILAFIVTSSSITFTFFSSSAAVQSNENKIGGGYLSQIYLASGS